MSDRWMKQGISRRLLLAALLVAALVQGAAAAEDTPLHRLNQALVGGHVIPRYERLAEATAKLAGAAKEFCASPSADVAALRGAYDDGLDAWIGVQHIRFGPVELLMRSMRFAFWPDPRNTTSKHLGEIIAKRDASVLAPGAFGKGSIAVQGFPALERLLYEEGAVDRLRAGDEEAQYRCALLQAITTNMQEMAAGVLGEWRDGETPFAGVVAAPGPDNPYYHDDKEATLDLFKSLHTAVELVADHKLRRPLGESATQAKPRLAESWRSGRSLRNVRLNLAAARELYLGAHDDGFSAYVRNTAGDTELDDLLRRAFDQTIATAEAITVPLEQAVADPAQRPAVEMLQKETAALKQLLAGKLPQAIGIPLGFNALDGD
jgi:uncharacterized protein